MCVSRLSVVLMNEGVWVSKPFSIAPHEAGPDDLSLYSFKCVQCSSRGKCDRCKYADLLNESLPWWRKALGRVKEQLFVFLSPHWAFQLAREHTMEGPCVEAIMQALCCPAPICYGVVREAALFREGNCLEKAHQPQHLCYKITRFWL